ncbi:MAG: WD40 repeat domain-containing serine/threonine protein kinase [Limisphaerales bacterium]
METLFNATLALPPGERLAYVAGASGANAEVRQRVEALLRASEASAGFLPEQARASSSLSSGSNADPSAPPAGTGADRHSSLKQQPGDRIGRYRLREKIGEGGCGVVYVAEQEEPVRRRVALKVIKLGMDTRQVIARFEAERQALALMDHPNIAKILDAGATNAGRPYFVMELVRGVRITDYCDENRLTTRERLDLFVKVCQAIQHAHQKGIIHRDIKPSNILVTVNDGVPIPKVIDFGIAKVTGGQELTDKTIYTAFEQFLGTPAYMSPEQSVMTSVDIDTRSDIYSLGVLLYELLTGRTPFDTKELLAVGLDGMRRTICEKEPLRPSKLVESLTKMRVAKPGAATLNPQFKPLSTDLDWIVMKCLEKDRTRRYETANGLARDLERYLNNEAVVARPASKAYRLQTFVRRNKVVVTSGVLITAVLLVGGIASTWQAIRATKAGHEQIRMRAAAQSAEATATERLIRLNIANAVRLTDEGNLLEALPCIAESIRLSKGTPAIEDNGRYRFESVWRQSPRLLILASHRSGLYVGSFSSDGHRFVTGSADRTAAVWDSESGQAVFPPLVHSDEVRKAIFSPNGERVATVTRDAKLWIWDGLTGHAICPPVQHVFDVKYVAFSPDSELILTCSGPVEWNTGPPRRRYSITQRYSLTADGGVESIVAEADDLAGEVHIFDSATGLRKGASLYHKSGVRYAAFSSDGIRLVSGCDDGSAVIWDLRTRQPVLPPLRSGGPIRCVAFSPDSHYVLTASEDNTAQLWDAGSGAALGLPMRHAGAVLHAAFSADGRRIVTTSRDQTACIWETGSGKLIVPPLHHESDVRYAEFSSDGRWLATSGSESLVRLWEVGSGRLRAILPHNSPGTFGTFRPDGQQLLTLARDHLARVWDLSPLSLAGAPIASGESVVWAEFSGDGRWALTSNTNQTAGLWDLESGQQRGSFVVDSNVSGAGLRAYFSPCDQRFIASGYGGVRVFNPSTGASNCVDLTRDQMICVLFSRDGSRVAAGSRDGRAQVWNSRNGLPLGPILKPKRSFVLVCAFSPDGTLLATGSADSYVSSQSELCVWDISSGRLIGPRIPIRGTVSCLSFDPTGRLLLTAATNPALDEREAQIWDWRAGRLAAPPLPHRDGIPWAEFSPDGCRVLTASYDTTAQIWEAKTGQRLGPPLGHTRQVRDAHFSPDGLRVATACQDGTARVWDAATGEPLTPSLIHSGAVMAVRFSPDGSRLMTVCDDYTVRIWHVTKTERPIADLLLWSALLSGHEIDSTGKSVQIEPAKLEAMWRVLKTK